MLHKKIDYLVCYCLGSAGDAQPLEKERMPLFSCHLSTDGTNGFSECIKVSVWALYEIAVIGLINPVVLAGKSEN